MVVDSVSAHCLFTSGMLPTQYRTKVVLIDARFIVANNLMLDEVAAGTTVDIANTQSLDEPRVRHVSSIHFNTEFA